MDFSGTAFFLQFFLLAAGCLRAGSYCLDPLRSWFAVCKDFANSRGFTFESGFADTSVRVFGNYAGFCLNLEVVVLGGYDALPPELNLRIAITDVGQVGDSFEIQEASFFDRKRVCFGNPELDRDYVLYNLPREYYGRLFTTPSFCESILKYHPNVLSLANRELTFSRRVTERQLEDIWVYTKFLVHLGKQINHLNDISAGTSEKRV